MGMMNNNPKLVIGKTNLLFLGLLSVITWTILIFGRQLIPKISALYFFELPPHPYLVPDHAVLFYIFSPVVILSSIFIWLLPGILITLWIGKTQRYAELIIWAFGTSFIVYLISSSIVKLLFSGTVSANYFLIGYGCITLFAWAGLVFQVYRKKNLPWPFQVKADYRRLIWSVFIPIIAVLLLFPIIFWQDMHGDGFEALEIGRSLSEFLWPRFPNPSMVSGFGLGMFPVAFPIHWFITLFGPIEASARFPLLLYLPIIFLMLVEMIEWMSPRKMEVAEDGLLILGLGIFTVAMSYNASYEAYFSDIASLTAVECLTITCIVGAVYFLWRENWFWFVSFSIIAYLCRPTSLIVFGLLAIAILLVMEEKRKRWLPILSVMIIFFFGLAYLFDNILLPWISGTTEFGYQSESIIQRVRYIRLFEPMRFNFALFPSGIIPFMSLFFIKWQDRYAKTITIIVLGYFGLFLFIANIALHHFVPVMVLPLVVFWRIYLGRIEWNRTVVLSVVGIAGMLSLWFSLPRSFEINRTVRLIGEKIKIEVGDYNQDYREMVRNVAMYAKLIPPDWEVSDRSKELITSPLALIYYGSREKRSDTRINYIIRYTHMPAPEDFTQVDTKAGVSLYVRDQEEWKADRFQNLNTKFMSPLYAIPRSTLFYYWSEPDGTKVIDLMQIGGVVKRFLLEIINRQ
jgi:hypothetical protein